MASQQRAKQRPTNKGSDLITNEENERLFSLLGKNNYTLASGVVQVLVAEPNPRQWNKLHTGVICLIKDYSSRAYYLRVYDLSLGLLWEQQLYDEFRVQKPAGILLTFEGDRHMVGLNFSSASEANNFHAQLEKKYDQDQKQKRKSMMPSSGGGMGPPRQPFSPSQPPQSNGTLNSPSQGGGISQIGIAAPMPTAYSVEKPKKSKKKDKVNKKSKLTKEQIGLPTNFVHKVHVGWDANKGLETTGTDGEEMDSTVSEFVRKATGMGELSKKDKKFVYEFLEERGGLEALKQELNRAPPSVEQQQHQSQGRSAPPKPPAPNIQRTQQPQYGYQGTQNQPPPPPSMTGYGQRGGGRQTQSPASKTHAPPPPPRDQGPPTAGTPNKGPAPPPPPPARPLPTPPQGGAGGVQTRPADIPPPPPMPQGGVMGAPPPPPPPPPPMGALSSGGGSGGNLPPVSGDRSDLMAAIRNRDKKGLKHVDADERAPPDSRSALNRQIEQGARLKPVDKSAEEDRKSQPEDLGGLAGALARALQERRGQIEDSDDSTGDEEEDDDDEWDD